MNQTPAVTVTVDSKEVEVPYGTPVGEVLAAHTSPKPVRLAAIVHNRCVDLDFPLKANARVRAVNYGMREGVLVYRRTSSLILYAAVRELYGDEARVSIGQARGNGYFYEIHAPGGFSQEKCDAIEGKVTEIVERDLPLTTEVVMTAVARRLFAKPGYESTLQLLKTRWEPHITLVHCAGFTDIHHYPVAPTTGYITRLAFVCRPGGLLLRFPQRLRPEQILPLEDSPRLIQVFKETRAWLNLLGVTTVGQLNDLVLAGGAAELIRIAEGLHEKKIAQIADRICDSDRDVQVVAVAGPSASGKTTFSKRLSLQLKVNGVQPVALSTDNFYVNRVDTPRDADGNYDFEALEAIDLSLFNDVLARLLAGEEVFAPRFDFQSGQRRPRDRWTPMRLRRGQVLVIEGIHGLNPRLTEAVPDSQKFRIYINALTQLAIDDHNRIFTSDTRFLRRIVRDRRFRGYSAAQTIQSWPSVRRGEMRWIYPYQEAADVMFNAALVYEFAVLRLYAERFLLEVPQEHPSFVNADRLLRFIEHFVPIFDEPIPLISLLREFIGGSYFDY